MLIAPDPLADHAIAAFLTAHLAQMHATSPRESVHALDLDALRAPGIHFLSARDDAGRVLGCGALKDLGRGEGELKSMRTDPALRRQGIASAILAQLLDHARGLGMHRVSLETGSQDFFAPARALYERHGFTPCGPFGGYRPDPNSAFLTRSL
ncbi:GNAT family N-acetyltransferase [Nocardioides sp.]|uniref:GNAT family N-acetyltransferase n=1 Tax=Nocardioides sp. TaxID=35761 RepID=UPI003516ADF7